MSFSIGVSGPGRGLGVSCPMRSGLAGRAPGGWVSSSRSLKNPIAMPPNQACAAILAEQISKTVPKSTSRQKILKSTHARNASTTGLWAFPGLCSMKPPVWQPVVLVKIRGSRIQLECPHPPCRSSLLSQAGSAPERHAARAATV